MTKEEAKLRATRDLTKEGLDIEAADSEYTPFTDEELDSALSGKTIVSNTGKIVTSFKKAPAGSVLPYVGNVDGELVYFSKEGVALDGTKLSLATTTISNKGTQGEAQTRSGDEAEFIMNSLNFKEQAAVKALAAIIGLEGKPLDYDDSKIKLMVAMAFRIAVEFQNRAIEFRKKEDPIEENEDIDIDISELTSISDKLLYNLINSLRRTDYEEDTKEVDEEGNPIKEYSERFINPKMNKIFKDYLKAIDAGTQDFAPQASTDPKDPQGTKYWDFENLLKLFWREQYKKDDTDEESNSIGSYAQRIINPKLNKAVKAFLKPTATSGTKEYLELVEFLDLYKKFFKSTAQDQDYAAFEDLTKLLKDLQATLDSNKWQRVTLYKWEEFKNVLTDIKTNIATLNTTLVNAFQVQATALNNINQSLQTFTTAMNNRLDTIDSSTRGLSSQISNAETNIINAMPEIPEFHCNYTPPSESK